MISRFYGHIMKWSLIHRSYKNIKKGKNSDALTRIKSKRMEQDYGCIPRTSN